MQRSSRSESLRNALVVSLALAVSYVAPRVASSPAAGPRAAASVHGIDFGALERSIASGEEFDAREARGWRSAARADRSHRKALAGAVSAARRAAADVEGE